MINMDEIGLLNRRIRLLQYVETEDEYGLTHQELKDAIGHHA